MICLKGTSLKRLSCLSNDVAHLCWPRPLPGQTWYSGERSRLPRRSLSCRSEGASFHLNTFSPPVLNTHDKQGEFLRTDAQRNSLKARISFGMHLDLSIIANARFQPLAGNV